MRYVVLPTMRSDVEIYTAWPSDCALPNHMPPSLALLFHHPMLNLPFPQNTLSHAKEMHSNQPLVQRDCDLAPANHLTQQSIIWAIGIHISTSELML